MSNLAIELIDGSDTIFLHFSSRNKKDGKFHRFHTPAHSSNVYINPADANWYLFGLPEYGNVENSVIILRDIIANSKASNVVCVGSSMGAWGAAYYAPKIGATHAILFSPELELNGFAGHSAENLRAIPDGFEMPCIEATEGCFYTTVAGTYCPSDVSCSVNFFSAGDFSRCYILPEMGHDTAARLSKLEVLSDVIDECLKFDGRSGILQGLATRDSELIQRLFFESKFCYEVLVEYVELLIEQGHGLRSLSACIEELVNRGLNVQALNVFSHFEGKVEYSNDLRVLRLRSARKAKRNDLALAISESLIDSPLYRKIALFERALVFERLGRNDEAKQLFQEIHDEHVSDTIFNLAVSRLKVV